MVGQKNLEKQTPEINLMLLRVNCVSQQINDFINQKSLVGHKISLS